MSLHCLAAPLRAEEPIEIAIEGIEGDALRNVREALTLPAGMTGEGKVDRLWLEHFKQQSTEKVRSALEPFGYYSARIGATIEDLGPDRYRLRVMVTTGEPVRVKTVEISLHGPGAEEESLKALVSTFPLHRGDLLLQKKYEDAKGRLLSQAQALGYADATFDLHEILIAPTKTDARIRLLLETGERYRFGEVKIEGTPGYPESFLRRYLAFKPGEIFSPAKLAETQLNLTNSDRFKEVIVTPEKEKNQQSLMAVLVRLKPNPPKTLHPGIGYGTDTGARVSLRYRDLNMLRLGHELNANLLIAQNIQGLATVYTIPSPRDIRSFTGIQLNLQRQDVVTYVSRLISLEVDRNRGFGPGRVGTAFVRLQQEDFTVGAQNSGARLVLPGLRFNENHYDNQIRPTQGYHYGIELHGVHQALGSDVDLLQLITDGSVLIPLPWRLSLHTRAKSATTLLSDSLVDLPVSLRFFAGGDQSVRGYSFQSLGPRDSSGKVAGGKHLLVGSAELERALFDKWGISLFYDAGNAFNSFDNIRLFQGAGAGVHYYSPIGALNLYLARQIGVDSPAWHIHFTVGFEL